MLVGNKLDLCDNDPAARQVSTEQAAEFARENGLLFMETSAVANLQVKEAFETLVQRIYDELAGKVKPNQPQPVPVAKIEPAVEVQPQSAEESKNEPASDVQPQSAEESKNEPASDVQPQSAEEAKNEPEEQKQPVD